MLLLYFNSCSAQISFYSQFCRELIHASNACITWRAHKQWAVVTHSEQSDEVIQVALKLPFKYTLHHIHPC